MTPSSSEIAFKNKSFSIDFTETIGQSVIRHLDTMRYNNHKTGNKLLDYAEGGAAATYRLPPF